MISSRRSTAALGIFAGFIAMGLSAWGAPLTAGAAQQTDTLTLATLQRAAVANDPRTARPALEAEASALRMENLTGVRRPQLSLLGETSYSSEVIRFPIVLPGAGGIAPPHDRYEVAAQADWLILDGGITTAQRGLESARLSGASAEVDAELYDLRLQVTRAFLSALLLQERVRSVDLLLEDLSAGAADLRVAVEVGTALPGDTAVLRAETLSARQRRDALESERLTSLDLLSDLTGRTIRASTVLPLPELARDVAQLDPTARAHPQFDVFAAQRATLDQQVSMIEARNGLKAAVFGQYALGTPGPRQFEEDPYGYWRAGLRLEWRPFDWDVAEREAEVTRVTSRIVDTREEAFAASLQRAVRKPLREMDRLRAAMDTDNEIIELREQVEARSRVQLNEGAIPASEWARARNDLLDAHVARAAHQIELVLAQAEYLTILGTEIR